MLTTTVFTAFFQFVVWTVSCLYDLPVQSLHLPFIAKGLGSGLPLADVPSDYKDWLLTQRDIDPFLRKALGT
jgi:hypothetical protein